MQKELFFRQLYEELVAQGASPETAKRQIRAVLQSITEDDLHDIEGIESNEEIAAMASAMLSVQKHKSQRDESMYGDDGDMKVYDASASQAISNANSAAVYNDPSMYAPTMIQDDIVPPVTKRGKLIFWGIFIVALPLIAAFLLAYAGVFGAIFAVLIAVIFALVAGMIVGVAGGTLVSTVGIVYGITQLWSAPSKAIGLYEIGEGVIIGGVVMFVGILIYNVAIRLVPFIMSLLVRLFKFCADKLKVLFRIAKEACYRI